MYNHNPDNFVLNWPLFKKHVNGHLPKRRERGRNWSTRKKPSADSPHICSTLWEAKTDRSGSFPRWTRRPTTIVIRPLGHSAPTPYITSRIIAVATNPLPFTLSSWRRRLVEKDTGRVDVGREGRGGGGAGAGKALLGAVQEWGGGGSKELETWRAFLRSWDCCLCE